jgi:hypothetical protein
MSNTTYFTPTSPLDARNSMYAPIKCHHAYVQMPERLDKCNQTHYSTFNSQQEISDSSKLNIGRFALHGAEQIVQLLVDLSILNTSTQTDDRSILVGQLRAFALQTTNIRFQGLVVSA